MLRRYLFALGFSNHANRSFFGSVKKVLGTGLPNRFVVLCRILERVIQGV